MKFLWADRTDPQIKPEDIVIFFDFWSPALYKYIILVLVISVISQNISLTLVVLTLKNLRTYSHKFSRQTYRMHVQFTILLGCQLLSPIIYIFVPLSMGIAATLFLLKPKKILLDVSFLGIAFYGLSNSLLSIAFISPYRRHFLDVFIFPWLKPLLKIVGFQSSSTSTQVQILSPTIVTPNAGF